MNVWKSPDWKVGHLLPAMLCMLAGTLIGCSSTELETGYRPTRLGDSPSMRRSYYASPFSAAASAPKQDREQELQSRRPTPGY
jgi:hypothetical protein